MPVLAPLDATGTEGIILDPSEVDSSRAELDLHADILRIDHEGIDWGEAAIQAYMAEGERGSSPVDFRLPNREVTIPLHAKASDADSTAFNASRVELQSKVALIQREGGSLKRTLANGAVYYLDIVNATLKMGGSTFAALERFDTDIELVLECLPDFYGDEIALDLITETTAASIHQVLTLSASPAVIKGDYPGRCRIVVTDTQGQDQLGLIWGIRSRYYDSAAPLVYEAEAMANMDTAVDAALTGASGGTVVRHSNLGATWTPVCFGAGTHLGTYRAWARVYTSTDPATAEVKCRLVSDVGDLTNPVENAPFTIPGASQFYLADLGEIRIDEAQVGAHYAIFMIQAKGEAGGKDFRIDKLWLQPVAEFAGRLSAPITVSDGLTAFSARDEFNQSAGALAGKTAAVGGTWAGAGDTDDFAVETTGHTAQRTAVSDGLTIPSGRFAVLPVTLSDVVVQVDLKLSVFNADTPTHGVVARYASTSNFAYAYLRRTFGLPEIALWVGTTTVAFAPLSTVLTNSWYTLRLGISSSGRALVWFGPRGGELPVVLTTSQVALAAGGGTASGYSGILDKYDPATAATRNYDNFAAWVPPRDAVIFASQSVELQTQGMYREDSAGTTSGPVSKVIGDLPRIPASGMEDRPVEIFTKLSRGDLDQLPDSAIDDLTLRVHYSPSWLFVPEA